LESQWDHPPHGVVSNTYQTGKALSSILVHVFFFLLSHVKICLESLEVRNLTHCSRLNKFPDSIGNMTSLHKLHLGGTAIKKLPLSFESLYSSLAFLDISDCSRLETIPKNMISGMKHLESLYSAGSDSDLISLLIPNSFSGSSSLTHLDLSICNLSERAIPSDHFSCLSSLFDLNLSRNKFTRIPDNARQLSSLTSLDLSYCNLLDGVIPNDLSCLSSLLSLKLSGNKFMRIPDSVGKLSHLQGLYLEDCSQLQVLPKLPLGLAGLFLRNCPSLKSFYNQMDIWTSNEKLLPLDCSVVTASVDHDGKPFKSLHLLPPSPLWSDKYSVSLLLVSFLTHEIKLYYCFVIVYMSSLSFFGFYFTAGRFLSQASMWPCVGGI
jgi:Leucine-rich repeat (LRR) protein